MKVRAQQGKTKTPWCHSIEEARTQAGMLGMQTYSVVNEAGFVEEIKLEDRVYEPRK